MTLTLPLLLVQFQQVQCGAAWPLCSTNTVETKTDTRVSETPWWPGPAAQQLDISGLEFLLVFIEYATGPAASSSGP